MKYYRVLIFCLFVTGIIGIIGWRLAFLQTKTLPKSNKPELIAAASIYPIYDIVRQISGPEFSVALILPPGADPHEFEPNPANYQQIKSAPLVFQVGFSLDDWVKKIVEPNQKLVALNQNLKTLVSYQPNSSNQEVGESDQTTSYDPHYWLSIDNAASIAATIQMELSLIHPEKSSLFRANQDKFMTTLVSLKSEGEKLKSAYPQIKKIATFHNAFNYFASDWGIEVAANFQEFTGEDPSANYLQEFSRQIKSQKLKIVYAEPAFSTKSLEPIAADLRVKIDVLDDIGGTINTDTYQSLILYNLNQIFRPL